MTVYRAHIVGLHGRSIGVVQLDCIDDESAIKSAGRLVDSHDVELWQMDRPVARLDACSKQMLRSSRGMSALGQSRRFGRAPGLSGSATSRPCEFGSRGY